jgi:hypothetical protein
MSLTLSTQRLLNVSGQIVTNRGYKKCQTVFEINFVVCLQFVTQSFETKTEKKS